MEKVQFTEVLSKRVKVNNLCNTERAMDISAVASIAGNSVTGVDEGVVTLNETRVATFNKWNHGNLSITYNVTTDDVNIKQQEILIAVQEFFGNLEITVVE